MACYDRLKSTNRNKHGAVDHSQFFPKSQFHRFGISPSLSSVSEQLPITSLSPSLTITFISCFGDLLDSIIVDVAYECHRIAKLRLDHNFEEEEELRLSAQTRVRVVDPSNSGEANSKHLIEIFGQNHPYVASKVFECMICGRSIVAGRFALHLEKCMGKGRKACLKVTRSSTAAETWNSRGNPASTYSTYSCSNSTSWLSNGASGVAGEEYSNCALEVP
ncbi:hypothetical protein ACFX12_006042 [Malus domestica]